MNKKRLVGILLLIFSLIILFWENNNLITGNAIGKSFSFSVGNILGFVLLIGSFVLLVSNRTLDKLVIPGGEDDWKKGRLDRTLAEKKSGRKIEEMYWLKGKDSEEDILLLGKKTKPGERIGFVTFPLHYLEYKELIKKAQRDEKFPKGVRTENLATEQGPKEWIYGTIGLTEEILKRRKLDYKKNRKEKYLGKIKKFVHKFI